MEKTTENKWTVALLKEATGLDWSVRGSRFYYGLSGAFITLMPAVVDKHKSWGYCVRILDPDPMPEADSRLVLRTKIRIASIVEKFCDLKDEQALFREELKAHRAKTSPGEIAWSAELLREITGLEWKLNVDDSYFC